MPRFRKKPVVIVAEQYTGPAELAIGQPMVPLPAGVAWHFSGAGAGHIAPFIDTLEGRMRVSPGDWIITGIAGERYPCKPDIFAATYEPVEEP